MLKLSLRMIMGISFLLSCVGLLVISYASKSQGQGPFHFFVMQLIFLLVALVVAWVCYSIDYHFYMRREVLWIIGIAIVVALLLVLVPGVGKAVKGSQRWIALGPINVQPSEFVKLAIVIFLASYLDIQGGLVNRLVRGVVYPTIYLAVVVGLLVLQPDFGSAFIVCCLAGVTLLVGGVGFWRCAALGALAIAAIVVMVALNPNRMARLRNEQEGENHQAIQSEIAFRNGGLTGMGLGAGMQRERYLPECHTDFIYAVVGEDFGFIATASIWAGFLLMLGFGSVIAFRAPDKQGMLIAFGATLVVCAQGVGNMGVVTHLFPTKGLALPFLSYGGSCLLASFASVGVLLGVGRVTIESASESATVRKRLVSFD